MSRLQKYFLLLIIICLCCCFIFYDTELTRKTHGRKLKPLWTKFLCKSDFVVNCSTLLPMETYTEGENNVFFMETSCSSSLNPRQACSVETAAKKSPKMKIIVGLTSECYQKNEIMEALLSYPNLRLSYMDLDSIFADTDLEKLHGDLRWYFESNWPSVILSEIARVTYVYKHGGVYSDLDMYYVAPFPEGSWLAKESSHYINSANFRLPKNHWFLRETMTRQAEHYNGAYWGFLGPKMFTNVYTDLCLKSNFSCNDLKVFDWNVFHPFQWQQYEQIFKPSLGEDWLKNMDAETVGIHAFSHMSTKISALAKTGSVIDIVAKQNCPQVYKFLK